MLNVSYIVNYPSSSAHFGCKRRCDCCNWRRLAESTLLQESRPEPALGQVYTSHESYGEGVAERITISGGGDPLYNPTREIGYVPQHTLTLIRESLKQGYKVVRIITREIATANYLINTALTPEERRHIEFSISLDFRTLSDIEAAYGIAILPYVKEFTYVPEAVPDFTDLIIMVHRLNNLLREANMDEKYVTIRENLRTVYSNTTQVTREKILEPLQRLMLSKIKFRWLPKSVCLNDIIYLIAPMPVFGFVDRLRGWAMMIDFEEVASFFVNHYGTILYGGAARQWTAMSYITAYPVIGAHHNHSFDFNDFDVFVAKADLAEVKSVLATRFYFSMVKNVDDKRITFVKDIDPTFKIVLYVVEELSVAWKIISQANIGIDRVGIHEGQAVFFDGFSLEDLFNGIARILPHTWKHMDKEKRKRSEERHIQKMEAKHFKIVKMNIFRRIQQWIIDKFR